MPLRVGKSALVLVFLLLIAAPAFAAYEYPLQTTEMRDAYFLGQRPGNAPAKFLTQYTHHISQVQTGEYIVTEVGILTPYAQIVQRGAKNVPGDSEVQLETDLRAHALPLIVQVTVSYGLVYPGDAGTVVSHGPHRGILIHVEQAHAVAPLKTTKYTFGGSRCPCGVVITTEFDAAKIASAPLHIIVGTPDGKSIRTDFDLTHLK